MALIDLTSRQNVRTGEALPTDQAKDDVWIRTVCDGCYSFCGILVHRVNGIVVKVEGDPVDPMSAGRLCPKGNALIMSLYDPHRVKTPLKRTNPQKGIGIDPQWQEISWDEALDIVCNRLKKIREEDPRRLLVASFDINAIMVEARAWALAFGTPNNRWVGYFCGNALHPITYLTNGTFQSEIDFDYCNYCLLIGTQMGAMSGLSPNVFARVMADARHRGMKVVVVDPVCSNVAAKADEWIPIRPGTDGALALAMVNILVNELGIHDSEFLKRRTNAPYLVGPDGNYVRQPGTNKPLIWDASQGEARPYDAQVSDPALLGSYTFGETHCQPAFQLIKEHIKRYSPEMASDITTIPADTIRRLAIEFGTAARVGSKISCQGKELPYRPAAVNMFRGSLAHKHGTLTGLAIQMLNTTVGSFYVPGGYRGINLKGPYWAPEEEVDGLIVPPPQIGEENPYHSRAGPPETAQVREMFPLAFNCSAPVQLNLTNPSLFKLPFKIEALIQCRINVMMNKVNLQAGNEALKSIPFIVSFATVIDEAAEFADIVLPEAHCLERLDMFPNNYYLSLSPATDSWYWRVRQPVAKPFPEVRQWTVVLEELADRLGFLGDYYQMLNMICELQGPYRLDSHMQYSHEEIADRWAKSMFGSDYGLSWFQEHGILSFDRTVEESYPAWFMKPRFPVYYENIKRVGEEVERVSRLLGIPLDTSDYQPIPDWKPCPDYRASDADIDLFAVNYKIPFHALSHTAENPWLNECGEHHPYAYKILIHPQTAQRKGIADGDSVWVESEAGKVKGRVKITEGVHPEVVAIGGVFGSWAQGKPIAKARGVHFNSLLPLTLGRMDTVSTAVDACVRVKVFKAL